MIAACALAVAGFGRPDGSSTRPSVVPVPGMPQSAPRFEGEYGLYVGWDGPDLVVRWLTDESAQGVVRATVDGRVVSERRTRRGDAHEARFRVDAPAVTLEYGAEDADGAERLHRTEIRLAPPPPPEVDLPAPDSVFVFGDAHGEFDDVLQMMSRAGLIDVQLRWTGGGATVAMLGDLLDRGDNVTRLLWFLYRIEREAAAAGGRVLTILGNHEVMVMSGDLRYVSSKEAAIAHRHEVPYPRLFHPSSSVLGRWLASKPGLVRLGDLLLAHGGVSPAYLDYSLHSFQDSLGAFISEPLLTGWHDDAFLDEFARSTTLDSAQVTRRYDFFFDPQSVLWYRDLVLTDTLGAHLDRVLDHFDAAVHVVGHTPVPAIGERYGGKLIAVESLDHMAKLLFLERRPDGGWDRYLIGFAGDRQPLHPDTGRPPPPPDTGTGR